MTGFWQIRYSNCLLAVCGIEKYSEIRSSGQAQAFRNYFGILLREVLLYAGMNFLQL
jgi:hypothetical protein